MADPQAEILASFFHRNRDLDLSAFARRHERPFLMEVSADDLPAPEAQFGTMVGYRAGGALLSGDVEITRDTPVFPLVKRGSVFPNKVTVGRSSNNDLVLDDGTVSKLHAYFTFERGRVFLTDAESKNGSTIDNKRLVALHKSECPNGSLIGFGPKLRFLFMTPELFYDRMVAAMR